MNSATRFNRRRIVWHIYRNPTGDTVEIWQKNKWVSLDGLELGLIRGWTYGYATNFAKKHAAKVGTATDLLIMQNAMDRIKLLKKSIADLE